MSCQNCVKVIKELLDMMTCIFPSRWHLALFLLNVILNIKEMWTKFCCCRTCEICLGCQAKLFYLNHEYDIYENCLDLDFLANLCGNVYRNLLKLLTLDSHFVCKLINTKYQYSHEDWFTDELQKFDLSVCLDMYEQKKWTKLKIINVKLFYFFF